MIKISDSEAGSKLALVALDACLSLNSALCSSHLRVLPLPDKMQRITARFLLLIALLGTVVPMAMQAKAAPPRACCLRKAPHHCHETSQAQPEQPVLQDAGCCNHNCCRAVTSSQWAHPLPSLTPATARDATGHGISDHFGGPLSVCSSFLHSRAPPASVLA